MEEAIVDYILFFVVSVLFFVLVYFSLEINKAILLDLYSDEKEEKWLVYYDKKGHRWWDAGNGDLSANKKNAVTYPSKEAAHKAACKASALHGHAFNTVNVED